MSKRVKNKRRLRKPRPVMKENVAGTKLYARTTRPHHFVAGKRRCVDGTMRRAIG